MKPVVKWVGGKTQLLDEINEFMPKEFNRYVEPFLGGAAVLFYIAPDKALVNDLNSELINMYKTVRNNSNSLMKKLDYHDENISKDYYYKIRELDRLVGLSNLSHIYRASRFIFLNKAGFNGLYRVNSEGYMNVPFGQKKKLNSYDEDNIKTISEFLKVNDIKFFNQDYKKFLLDNAKKDDFVYLDPPYDPIDETSAFVAYQKNGFGKEQQKELRDVCIELHKRGAKIMLSNSNTPYINELYNEYKDIFNIKIVYARRSINSKGNKRGEVEEVIIRNYGGE